MEIWEKGMEAVCSAELQDALGEERGEQEPNRISCAYHLLSMLHLAGTVRNKLMKVYLKRAKGNQW